MGNMTLTLLKEPCRLGRYGGRSSVGRAQGCGPCGRGFESHRSPHQSASVADRNVVSAVCLDLFLAPVAQLDRAPDFESVGRRFEPCRACQIPVTIPLGKLIPTCGVVF
jgi:hypothetical protein